MKIITNNIPRFTLTGFDIPSAFFEQGGEFDYTTAEDWSGFKYKGQYYDLGAFMCCNIPGWDGAAADTYFSGVLVRLSSDGEEITVGFYYS